MDRVFGTFTRINLKHCCLVITQKSHGSNLRTVSHKFQQLSVRSYRAVGIKSAMTKATGNRLNWKLTAEGIKKSADDLIATHKKIWDDVGSVKHADASYENVMKVISCLVFNCICYVHDHYLGSN